MFYALHVSKVSLLFSHTFSLEFEHRILEQNSFSFRYLNALLYCPLASHDTIGKSFWLLFIWPFSLLLSDSRRSMLLFSFGECGEYIINVWVHSVILTLKFQPYISNRPQTESKLEAAHGEHYKGHWAKSRTGGTHMRWIPCYHNKEWGKKKVSQTPEFHDIMLWTSFPLTLLCSLFTEDRGSPLTCFTRFFSICLTACSSSSPVWGDNQVCWRDSVSYTQKLPVLCLLLHSWNKTIILPS